MRSDFVAGVRTVAPVLPGTIPFGMIVGAAAASIGLPAVKATVMSLAFFAGASQLTAIQLITENAPAAIIVFTALVINVRYLVVSAGIAPYFRNFTTRWKCLLGYLLTTTGYVLAVAEYEDDPTTNRRAYYLGVHLPLWFAWQASFIVGLVLGARVPPSLQLDFAFPLVFLAVLFPSLDDRTAEITASIAGIVALSAGVVPFSLELILAVIVGVGGGLLADHQLASEAA